MKSTRTASVALSGVISLFMAGFSSQSQAQGPSLNLATAVGTVEKVEANKLLMRVGSTSAKSGRGLTLNIIGTSKVSTLIRRTTDGRLILSQRELPVKSLKKNQRIAVVYTRVGGQPILLNGVVKPNPSSSSTKKTKKKTTKKRKK